MLCGRKFGNVSLPVFDNVVFHTTSVFHNFWKKATPLLLLYSCLQFAYYGFYSTFCSVAKVAMVIALLRKLLLTENSVLRKKSNLERLQFWKKATLPLLLYSCRQFAYYRSYFTYYFVASLAMCHCLSSTM